MNIAKLFLPGRFEDAYIYMGRLVVLTENKTIRIYNLDQIVADLEEQYPATIPVPTLMFSRNDWLASHQFISLMRNKNVAQDIFSAFKIFSDQVIDLGQFIRPGRFSEQDLHISATAFLDMHIYSARLYLGADNGFYSINIDWKNPLPELSHSSKNKKLDASCFNISARYGTVNASCGDDGLFSFINDFGWWKDGQVGRKINVADTSLKTAWLDYDLINYPSYGSPSLFKSTAEKTDDGLEKEGKVLTQIGNEGEDLSYLLHTVTSSTLLKKRNGFRTVHANYPSSYFIHEHSSNYGEDEIQFSYNADHRLFVQTKGGRFFSSRITRSKKGEIKPEHAKESSGGIGRILTIQPGKAGPIIETEESVLLFAEEENRLYPITEFGALTVRTFPRSKRFQNLAVVTTEDGTWLVGMFDDLQLSNQANTEYIHEF
ncbi:MAG: hypothetical protein WCD86_27345 [Ktedonobacteraceae bacterium]